MTSALHQQAHGRHLLAQCSQSMACSQSRAWQGRPRLHPSNQQPVPWAHCRHGSCMHGAQHAGHGAAHTLHLGAIGGQVLTQVSDAFSGFAEGGQHLEVQQDNGNLQELCQSLLHALFQLLPRFGSRSSSDLRATVYSRCPASLESGSLQLQRIACWPAEPNSAHGDAVLGQHMPLYGRGYGAGSAAVDDEHRLVLHNAREGRGLVSSTEESLVQEECIKLPNSASLVFPLSEQGFLVGMLIIEHTTPMDSTAHSSNPLSDDELWCIRTFVRPFTQACALDVKSVLVDAQHSAQQRYARTLLSEARGPLSALQTFGSMLVPRLDDGEPDKDMARGIMMQGQRLQEVVAELEAALRPAAAPLPTLGLLQQQGAADGPGPFMQAPAPALGTGRWLQLPGPSNGSSSRTGTSSSSSLSVMSSSGWPAQWQLPSPPPPASSHGALPAPSAAQSSATSLPPPPAARTPIKPVAVEAVPVEIAGADPRATIDLEVQPFPSTAQSRERGSAKVVRAGPANRPRVAAYAGECNVVEALTNVLTAAFKVAKLMKISLVINAPLHVVLSSSASTSSRSSGSADSSKRRDSSAPLPRLLPRPVRPLMVGVCAAVVQRAAGYLLDLALQCTPRGGQVCVTARESRTGGVELLLMHTGHLLPERLHQASRGIANALQGVLSGNAAAGGGPFASGDGSSRVVGLEFAQQLIRDAGGKLEVAYPCDLMNSVSGQMDVGTSVHVWLPPPSNMAAAAGAK